MEWEAVLTNPLEWDWQQYQDKEWADDEPQFRYVATDKGDAVIWHPSEYGVTLRQG